MSTLTLDIMQELNIIAKAGDTLPFVIAVKNPDNSDYSFTGHSARMQVRESAASSRVLISLTSSSGIILSTGSIAINASASSTQIAPGVYYYDIEIVLPGGTVQTWFGGTFTVNGDVTRT